MSTASGRDGALVGVDVGTTAVKAAVFTPGGTLLAEAAVEHPTRFTRPGWAEQDPDDWWRGACAALRCALEEAGRPGVAAVCVSAQAPTLLALDAHDRPLRPALIWMDRRAEAECDALRETVGEDAVRRTTGNRIDPFFVAPKLLWLRSHEPGLFARTRAFAQVTGYVVQRLTGELTLDREHASLLSLRELATDEWSPRLLEACGVEPERFPRLVDADELVGAVSDAAAAETGLPSGTPVCGGTVDGAAAALQAGAIDEGRAAEMTGTSTVVLLPASEPRSEPALIAMRHAVRGRWLLLGAMVATGASLRWLRDLAGGPTYEALATEAGREPAGAHGLVFLPYMMGERSPLWDSDARGVFVGLTLGTGRAGLARAVLEGAAFALRHNLETAESAGITVTELRSVGGGARSAVWSQIKADVTGVPVVVPQASAGAVLGDAALAGVAAGLLHDVRELVDTVPVAARYEPRADVRRAYEPFYETYRGLYPSLRGHLAALARAAA